MEISKPLRDALGSLLERSPPFVAWPIWRALRQKRFTDELLNAVLRWATIAVAAHRWDRIRCGIEASREGGWRKQLGELTAYIDALDALLGDWVGSVPGELGASLRTLRGGAEEAWLDRCALSHSAGKFQLGDPVELIRILRPLLEAELLVCSDIDNDAPDDERVWIFERVRGTAAPRVQVYRGRPDGHDARKHRCYLAARTEPVGDGAALRLHLVDLTPYVFLGSQVLPGIEHHRTEHIWLLAPVLKDERSERRPGEDWLYGVSEVPVRVNPNCVALMRHLERLTPAEAPSLGVERLGFPLEPAHLPRIVVETHDALPLQIREALQRQGWQIRGVLGQSTSNAVVHVETGQETHLAVKVLERPVSARQRALIERAARLGSTASGLVHYYPEHSRFDDSPSIVAMEYVDGEPLDLWTSRTQGDEERRTVARGLVAVVARLHRAGIVHRDLHPGNVLVRRGSVEPVIIDLGFARENAPRHSLSSQASTRVNEARGWGVAPFAPELQRQGRVFDSATWPQLDVHALAWLTACVVVGRLPAPGDDALGKFLEPTHVGWRWLEGWLLPSREATRVADADHALSELARFLDTETDASHFVCPGWRHLAQGHEGRWVSDSQGKLGLVLKLNGGLQTAARLDWGSTRISALVSPLYLASSHDSPYANVVVIAPPELNSPLLEFLREPHPLPNLLRILLYVADLCRSYWRERPAFALDWRDAHISGGMHLQFLRPRDPGTIEQDASALLRLLGDALNCSKPAEIPVGEDAYLDPSFVTEIAPGETQSLDTLVQRAAQDRGEPSLAHGIIVHPSLDENVQALFDALASHATLDPRRTVEQSLESLSESIRWLRAALDPQLTDEIWAAARPRIEGDAFHEAQRASYTAYGQAYDERLHEYEAWRIGEQARIDQERERWHEEQLEREREEHERARQEKRPTREISREPFVEEVADFASWLGEDRRIHSEWAPHGWSVTLSYDLAEQRGEIRLSGVPAPLRRYPVPNVVMPACEQHRIPSAADRIRISLDRARNELALLGSETKNGALRRERDRLRAHLALATRLRSLTWALLCVDAITERIRWRAFEESWMGSVCTERGLWAEIPARVEAFRPELARIIREAHNAWPALPDIGCLNAWFDALRLLLDEEVADDVAIAGQRRRRVGRLREPYFRADGTWCHGPPPWSEETGIGLFGALPELRLMPIRTR